MTMTRKPIKPMPGSIFDFSSVKADIRACWIDCADESTHTIDADGTRLAHCKLGSGERMWPLTKDSEGRWCVEMKPGERYDHT